MRSPEDLALIASIADDLPAGIWVATVPEGRFVYSNRAFEEILGVGGLADVAAGEYAQPYGIFGRDGALYPEEKMPFVRALQARATVVVDDIVIHRRDGRRVYVRAHAKPMFDAAGEMTHIAIAFFDITREATAEQARAQAERLASVGMLAAGVAHEINNPLAYVIGNLELLTGRLANRDVIGKSDIELLRGMLEDARHGAERVRAIVRDLKVFSRAPDARQGVMDLQRPLLAAVELARNEIRHRARLVIDLKSVPRVLADEGRANQLFLNLLMNAAQAIADGNAEHNEIRVASHEDAEGHAVFEVEDSGVGIAPETLPRIFDPFFTTKPIGVGTGLGLSICHAIVTDLGGRIEVTSEVGKGTRFRVVLPAAMEDRAIVDAAATESPKDPLRAQVLVVDDEPQILKLVEAQLGAEHSVVCEQRAASAFARIERGERYDAILCDVMMPDMTGIDLYEKILAIAPDQARAMIFVTGGAFTARAREFLERVPNARLEKPFDVHELSELVRRKL